jgi:hypothetical protein
VIDFTARGLRWSLVSLLWLTSTYLVVYYTAVLLLGPERLFRLLGEAAYNALIPTGGFPLLVLMAVGAVVWIIPFCVAFAAVSVLLSVCSLTRRSRLWAAAVLAAGLTLSLPLIMLDGWPWALMRLAWEDDTQFAPGYSAVGFSLVSVGMTPAEVVAAVGPPLERYPIPESGEEGWRWTRSPHHSSYRVRVVVFRKGRVSEKHLEFYVD